MTADKIKAAYAADLRETITVRRYSGTGAARSSIDVEVRGKAAAYDSHEIVGSIALGDQRVFVYVDDLGAITLPLTTQDKIVVEGKEAAIIVPAERKAPDGTLVAYELQVRG